MTDAPQTHNDNACIRSQNNKTLLAVGVSLIIGIGGGYYIKDQNLLAKPGDAGSGSASDSQIEEVVKKVIADNPQMILDSLQSLQRKNYEKQMQASKEGMSKYKSEIFGDKHSPVVGDKSAAKSVVVFYDYHCGYCERVAPVIGKLIENHKDVKVVFKEFPILSPDSHSASKAALAVSALKPEKFNEFFHLLMQVQGGYSEDVLVGLAEKVGVSGDDLKKEMAESWVADEIKQVAELAGKLGIQGTPAIVVGGELIPGYMEYDALDAKVKAAKE